MVRWLRRVALGIPSAVVSFERRGFPGRHFAAREALEAIACEFLAGYHAALEEASAVSLVARLHGVEPRHRGFAFEGAAMALALLDLLAPWRERLACLLRRSPGHVYTLHVGAGWAMARLPWRAAALRRRLDPELCWLAFDGYGFHEGFFHTARALGAGAVPHRLSGYARRAFDQGLGRSLWFVHGADPEGISRAVAALAPGRHPDLWSGVGLACAYAGGCGGAAIERLRKLAAGHRDALAQGACFAAEARERAGIATAHTDLACGLLCGLAAGEAARLAMAEHAGLPTAGANPPYELWRQRVQRRFAREWAA